MPEPSPPTESRTIIIVGCPAGQLINLYYMAESLGLHVLAVDSINDLSPDHARIEHHLAQEDSPVVFHYPDRIIEGQTIQLEEVFMLASESTRNSIKELAEAIRTFSLELTTYEEQVNWKPTRPRKRGKRGHNRFRDRIIT